MATHTSSEATGTESDLEEMAREVVDGMKNEKFDSSQLGGSLANTLYETLEGAHPGACAPLRDDSCCDHCGKVSPKQMVCSRCRRASYCSHACQKVAWKTHKPACPTHEQRVDDVVALLERRETNEPPSRSCVSAALAITGERVHAAWLLLNSIRMGHTVTAVDEEDFCACCRLLFGARVSASDLRALEAALPPATREALAAKRADKAAEAAAMAEAMAPIVRQCDEIHRLMTFHRRAPNDGIMPGLACVRYTPPPAGGSAYPQPHPRNRDLLDYVHGWLHAGPLEERFIGRPRCARHYSRARAARHPPRALLLEFSEERAFSPQ